MVWICGTESSLVEHASAVYDGTQTITLNKSLDLYIDSIKISIYRKVDHYFVSTNGYRAIKFTVLTIRKVVGSNPTQFFFFPLTTDDFFLNKFYPKRKNTCSVTLK